MAQQECEDLGALIVLLKKIKCEAEKLHKQIDFIVKRGENTVLRADSIVSDCTREMVMTRTKNVLKGLIDNLVDMNMNLEFEGDALEDYHIPYPPLDVALRLKFSAGDNPWNFWLVDDTIATKDLHKLLLKKYQQNLLEPHPNPLPSDSVCFYYRNKILRGIVQSSSDNRVKVLDCESNLTKVVTLNKVFKADPDACSVRASTIKCTIAKETADVQLWNSDLRDIFCNALKEAVLDVKILQKLPGCLPYFLVEVIMKNDEEDGIGDLQGWIIGRLLPELKKLPAAQDDCILDFLSTEALNPYNIDESNTPGDLATCNPVTEVLNIAEPDSSSSDEDNNLNVNGDKGKLNDEPNIFNVTSDNKPTSDNMPSPCLKDELIEPNEFKITPSQNLKKARSQKKLNNQYDNMELVQQQSEGVPLNNNILNSNQRFVGAPYFISHVPHPYCGPSFRLGPPPLPSSQWSFNASSIRSGPPVYYPPWRQHPSAYSVMKVANYGHSAPLRRPDYSQAQLTALATHNGNMAESPSQNLIDPDYFPSKKDAPQDSSVTDNDCSLSQSSLNVNAREFSQSRPSSPPVPPPAPPPTPLVNMSTPDLVPKTETIIMQKHEGHPTPLGNGSCHVVLKKQSTLLKPGEKLLVMISYVFSPGEFYVHFVNKTNQYLDRLYDEMFSYFNSEDRETHFSLTSEETKWILGKFCACKWSEDNHWYRAEVIDWAPSPGHVRVYFVDHGNMGTEPLDSLRPLPQQFTKLPMCAQLCHLAQVLPKEKNSQWSSESINYFKSKVKVSNSKVYTVSVMPTTEKNGTANSLSVLLYAGSISENIMSINEIKSINEELVNLGLAWSKEFVKSPASSSYHSAVSELSASEITSQLSGSSTLVPEPPEPSLESAWDDWDPMTEDFKGERNNPARDTDDAGVALIGYSAQDESRICHFYARDGHCRKVLCNKEHTKPNPDGVTTDKEEVYRRAFAEMALPPVGQRLMVMVTAVLSVSLFYVQLPKPLAIDVKSDSDEEETLQQLGEFMNQPHNVQKMRYLRVPPAVAQLVLACWEGQWYRARVMGFEDTAVEVMFVDYGSQSTVLECDLREMEPRYLHLPFQAVECSLANIVTTEDEIVTETFKQLVEGNQLNARVYSSSCSSEFYQMELVLADENGDIGSKLIDIGLVKERPLLWNCKSHQMRIYPG